MSEKRPRKRPHIQIDATMHTPPADSTNKIEHVTLECLKMIFITTLGFIAAQWVSFIITRVEQAVMVEWYWRVVGLECGAMMLKAIVKIIVARVKKKEDLDIPEETTDESFDFETEE